MNCFQEKGHGQCNCGCPVLWSTEKKIRVLQEKLEALQDQKKEIETLIKELKSGKS